ncbi:MAG TPA: ABC transporter permease [Solirubrobacteraceae bacterium]|nr:ABC transporter permease [Solirubrobacteraceae bacterium]
MNALPYTRYELLRTFRNRRYLILSLGFPVVLYFTVAGGNRHAHLDGLAFPLYYMIAMASFGTMGAMISSGARISAERAVGWNRQLRISPLSTRAYFRTKVLTAYLTALLSLIVLYVCGASLGVNLAAGDWLKMTGLILVGLIPFAALGILVGHLLTPDSIGPAMGGGVSLLALLGGVFFPLGSGTLHEIAQYIPSYWLVQAAHAGIGGHPWGTQAWAVLIVWTLALSWLARRAYRNDTGRV